MNASTAMPKRESTAVKIDKELWHKAKTIAHANGEKMSDYFNRLLRPQIERDHPKALKKLGGQPGASPDN